MTGEDRRELMALQYQVGRLELENMELEQHRIVHESILKGKDLIIQKLRLQLAVRDKIINRQQAILLDHNLDNKVGYEQLTLLEDTLMGDIEMNPHIPPSPPRNMEDMLNISPIKLTKHPAASLDNKHYEENHSVYKSKPAVPALKIHGGGNKAQVSSNADYRNKFPNFDEAEDEDNEYADNMQDDNEDNDAEQGSNIKNIKNITNISGTGNGTQSTHLSNIANTTGSNSLLSDDEEVHRAKENKAKVVPLQDEIDDGYSMMPFTEREVALTARDRDLIEEGEWAEIQSELSDNSFSFYDNANSNTKKGKGNRAEAKKKVVRKEAKNNNSKANNAPSNNNCISNIAEGKTKSNVVLASQQASKDSKGVHGQRGGRLYRSSVPDSSNAIAASEGGNQSKYYRNKVVPVEDSDEDSNVNNKSRFRHYNSPRNYKESDGNKLDPHSMPPLVQLSEEIGILSGRRYSDNTGGIKTDASPRNDGGRYAVIYPTNKEASHGAGGAIRQTGLSTIQPVGAGGGAGIGGRAAGKALDEEVPDLDSSSDQPTGAGNLGLVVRSKGLVGTGAGGMSKPVLGKLKSKVNSMSTDVSSAAAGVGNISSPSNGASDVSLITVEGLSAGVNVNRPSYRFKPLGRPSKIVAKSALGAEDTAAIMGTQSGSQLHHDFADYGANSSSNSAGYNNYSSAAELHGVLLAGVGVGRQASSLPLLSKHGNGSGIANGGVLSENK